MSPERHDVPPSRRSLLAAVGTLGVTSLAGCGSVLPRSHVSLGCVAVSNRHAEPHTVRLRIDRNGEVVHESIHALAAAREAGGSVDMDSAAVAPTWPRSGRFVIRTRLDDELWTETVVDDLTSPNGSGCVGVERRVLAADATGGGSRTARFGTLVSNCGDSILCADGTTDGD